MMTTDGEAARSRRRPFDPTLRPRNVEATMPAVFERLCRERLDLLAAAGRAELVHEYFEPVSVLSLAHLMGIAHLVDAPTLIRWFAGLAAGVAYVLDEKGASAARVNTQMVGIEKLEDAREIAELKAMVQRVVAQDANATHAAVWAEIKGPLRVRSYQDMTRWDYGRSLRRLEARLSLMGAGV